MAIIGNQNVLRLEVPVVDPKGMAVLDGIQKLEEHVLGKSVVTNEASSLSDIAEKVTFRAVLDDNERAVGAIHDAHQRDHIGMLAGLIMHGDLSSLEALLSGVHSMFGEGFHGVQLIGVDVDSLINNTVGTYSENGNKFESVGQDTAESIFGSDTC